MEWIRQKLDKIREPFNKGNKLEKYAPAINALDTFLYTPKSYYSKRSTC
jgi:Na+-transporting NADH:ubiquinone oxidoreductase subunit B